MTRISVVTVTFRGGDTVGRVLEALACAPKRLGSAAELSAVIVDNASCDGTVEAACGVVIARSRDADLIVLLNPDVEVRTDFLARLVALDWPPAIAARGPAVMSMGTSSSPLRVVFPVGKQLCSAVHHYSFVRDRGAARCVESCWRIRMLEPKLLTGYLEGA